MLLVAAAAACSGGGSSSATSSSVPTATTLPGSGTVSLGGRVYTVAAPGQTLSLDDIKVRVHGVRWVRSAGVPAAPPGTTRYAIATLTVANAGTVPYRIALTQIWLLDPARVPYLAAARSSAPRPLVGAELAPGGSRTGTLVFPAPRKFPAGSLLVYRFADAGAIAKAKHVGIARFQS